MSKSPKPAPPPASYELALAELDRLVAEMEAGQLPLDALLASHQRAGVLLAFCRERLAVVEQQVQVLADDHAAPTAP